MSTTDCKVCGTEIKSGVCPYCGFENIVILGATDDSKMDEYANSYKSKVINIIKNISVKTYKYEWNSSKSDVVLLEEGKTKICDGKDCFEKVFLCNEKFKQNPAENEERELTLSYEFNGKEKSLVVIIKPEKSPGHWELGVKIDDDLRLGVYIGYNGKYVEKTGIKIDLHE